MESYDWIYRGYQYGQHFEDKYAPPATFPSHEARELFFDGVEYARRYSRPEGEDYAY